MMHKDCLSRKGWDVLSNLEELLLKHQAVLAGGTGLALQIGHRLSEDLDFFTGKSFTTESVIDDFRRSGLPFKLISEEEGSITLDFNGIKVSLFRYRYPFLDKPVLLKGITVAGLLDIASMKVIAISQRGTKRDFADLYCILRNIPFHLIAAHVVKRFGPERINPVHIGKSLVYFADADSEPEPVYPKGNELSWNTIKQFLRAHVKQYVFDLDGALKNSR